jgi:hypothetical protein
MFKFVPSVGLEPPVTSVFMVSAVHVSQLRLKIPRKRTAPVEGGI